MKNKIFHLLLISFCLSYTKVQAQWQIVYDSSYYPNSVPSLCSDGNNIFMYNDFGVSITKDFGKTWKLIDSSKIMKYARGFIRVDNKLLSSTSYGIYQSLDSGMTWSFLSSWPTWGYNWRGFLVSGNNILASSEFDRVIISKDGGFTWDSSNNGLLPTRISPRKVRYFYGFANAGNNILAFQDDNEYISYDHGLNWHLKKGNIPFYTGFFYYMGKSIFALRSEMYVSRDSGDSWQKILSPKHVINSLGGFATDGKIIITSIKNEGVLVSKDSGNTWINMNKGLTTLYVGSFIIRNGFVYCAGESGKIFRRPLFELEGPEEFVGIKENDNKLNELLHLKIYPNPLRYSTTIEFNKKLNNGLLIICNIQGQEVRVIKKINTNNVTIQKEDLNSGIYIYSIKEGGQNLGFGQMIIE